MGSGGVADRIVDILPIIEKETGSHVIFDDNPRRLVERCVEDFKSHPQHIRSREAAE
jgi:hypothetical protein